METLILEDLLILFENYFLLLLFAEVIAQNIVSLCVYRDPTIFRFADPVRIFRNYTYVGLLYDICTHSQQQCPIFSGLMNVIDQR